LFTYARYDLEDREVFLKNVTGKTGPVTTESSAQHAPNYNEDTTSGSDMDAEGETDMDEESSLSEAEDEDEPQLKEEIYTDDNFPRLSEDEANLGGTGSAYTIVEERVMARYIVNFAKSHNLSSVYEWDHYSPAEERWGAFVEKVCQLMKMQLLASAEVILRLARDSTHKERKQLGGNSSVKTRTVSNFNATNAY
jgi:hypothetical protein